MKRPGHPRTDPEKARDWQNRSRRPLPRMSARRRRSLPERDLVRRTVIARHRRRCAAWGIPGVPHDHTGPLVVNDADLEVHELRRGQRRHTDWLDPNWCIPLCRAAHRWATADGYPEPARTVGLVAASWETNPDDVHARRVAAGGDP